MKRLAFLSTMLAPLAAHATVPLTTHVPPAVSDHTAQRAGVPPRDQAMDLVLSLPSRNELALRALLRDLYDPASQRFRQYLSVADFTERFGPRLEDYQALQRFAQTHSLRVTATAANRRQLEVQASVADVEQAFHVTIGLYRSQPGAPLFYAPDREPNPDLAMPLLHVSGLDNEVPPFTHFVHQTTSSHTATGSGPDGNFLGSDIRAAYYGGTTLTGAGQSLGLLEFKGYNIADVQNYFTQVNQPLNVPVIGESTDGSSLKCTGKCDDGEQVLDIEEAISMAPAMKQVVVYVGKTDVAMLNAMATDNSCKQLSSSWGWKADAATIDPILEEFAAQGQSFVDATGDDGYQLLRDAVWPGDDQNVTGVGGTDLQTSGPGGPWLKEVAWHYSGGGPSPDHIAIPAYQVPFITPENNGSKKLRNVPDIAGDANTDNFSCYDGTCNTGNGGTSYAAPLLAGFIALVNEQATAKNKPPVGFLNPTLYTLGATKNYRHLFHDETIGNNGRYIAEHGFDLVTGFGSPAGQNLIDALIRGK